MTKIIFSDGIHTIEIVKLLSRGVHPYVVNRSYTKIDDTIIHMGSLACYDKHAVYEEVSRLAKHYKMTYKRKLNKWFDSQ